MRFPSRLMADHAVRCPASTSTHEAATPAQPGAVIVRRSTTDASVDRALTEPLFSGSWTEKPVGRAARSASWHGAATANRPAKTTARAIRLMVDLGVLMLGGGHGGDDMPREHTPGLHLGEIPLFLRAKGGLWTRTFRSAAPHARNAPCR